MINQDIIYVIVLYLDSDTVCSLTKLLKTPNNLQFLDIILKRDFRLRTTDIPENICFAPFLVITHLKLNNSSSSWKHLIRISNPLIRKTKIFYTIVNQILNAQIFYNLSGDVYSDDENLHTLTIAVAKIVAACPIFSIVLFEYKDTPTEMMRTVNVKDLVEYEQKLEANDKEKNCLDVTPTFDFQNGLMSDDSEYRHMYPVFEAAWDSDRGGYQFQEGVMLSFLDPDILYFAAARWSDCRPETMYFIYRLNCSSSSLLDTKPMRSAIETWAVVECRLPSISKTNYWRCSHVRSIYSEVVDFRTELQEKLSEKIRKIAKKLNKHLRQSPTITSLKFTQRLKLEQFLDCSMPRYDENLKTYAFDYGGVVKNPSRRVVIALERLLRRCVNCFVLPKLRDIDWNILKDEKNGPLCHFPYLGKSSQQQNEVSVHSTQPKCWPCYVTVDGIAELQTIRRSVVHLVKLLVKRI